MEYRKFGSRYVVRLDRGEEIVECIKKLCKENKIRLGTVTGIGAVDKVDIGLFKPGVKEYYTKEITEEMELTGLMGNISEMNGEVYLHLHITLADSNYNVIGGHLNSAVISATGEIIIDAIEGSVDREFSSKIGLNLLKF